MGVFTKARGLFAIGDLAEPLGRALLLEQFRVLQKQVPVLYAVLMLTSLSGEFILPSSVPAWQRLIVPGALLTAGIVRLSQWLALKGVEPTAEIAWRNLVVTRISVALLNLGFIIWTLGLFQTLDSQLRVPLALLAYMGAVAIAYCLGSFPAASRLTMLITGAPIAARLLISCEPMLLCLGTSLALLLILIGRMISTNFNNLVDLVRAQAGLAEEGERARAAERDAIDEKSKTSGIAGHFDTALNNMSHGLCLFDGERRLIVCNRQYLEIYGLSPDSVRPGMELKEIVELRFQAGNGPLMSRENYLDWRGNVQFINEPSEAVVELRNGRVVRICHHPMQDNGWVATHEDITERYRTEQALAEAKAAAEQAEAAARTAHTRLMEALDVVPEGLVVFDKEDRLVLWNRQYAELYNASGEPLTAGARFEDILRTGLAHQQHLDAVGHEEQWLAERLARHGMPRHSHEQQLPGDRWVRVEERRTADGGSIGVRIDITDLKRREASFRLLFEENPLPMWVADAGSGELLAVNAAMCRHYGYTRENLLAMTERDLDCEPDTAHESATAQAQDAVHHRRADGSAIEVVIESRPLMYQGKPARVAVAFDVTERNRAQQKIRYLASHDPLTELPNRAALDAHLASRVDASERSGKSFAVLCIDLDHFKEFNDLFGHAVGDAVLREASRRLREQAKGAFVARAGGDEFVATTDELPLPAAAELLATRMRSAFNKPIEVDGHVLEVDLSIGMALFPRDADDLVSLLANADAALYRAKHEGRGAIRLFTSAMDQQLRDRRAMEHDLRCAVDNGELYLEYQPQQHKNGAIVGLEALVRWRHPLRGIVPPCEFIPVAEKSGAIAKIDEWVLRQACRQAALWDDSVRIAVNVSAAQFRRENLEQQVRTALADTGLAPSRLELEITEGVLIEDIARATETLRSLKALGVMIALDDFGTGYSSLSYLEAFPLDRIKIDRSFVASLGASGRSLAIVRAVIGLAHGFAVPVLAEGVETAEQLAILAREGCDEMQGYLIGRPQPAEAHAGLLKTSGRSLRVRAQAASESVLAERDELPSSRSVVL